MQTFLPYSDFRECAQVLDNKRLGKQRVEANTILVELIVPGGWNSHPAVKMWKGYSSALMAYTYYMVEEWERRGFKNTIGTVLPKQYKDPPWLGDERLHSSHRSNLLRKAPDYYGQYEWSEPNNIPYFWPSKHPDYQ